MVSANKSNVADGPARALALSEGRGARGTLQQDMLHPACHGSNAATSLTFSVVNYREGDR